MNSRRRISKCTIYPYLKRIFEECKKTHPHVPLILYSSGSGGFLERLAQTGADVISLDGTVFMTWTPLARFRMGQAVQGNMDPVHLFASQDFITKKVHETIQKAGNTKHVMNLGHGVMVGTPEENVAHFFSTVARLPILDSSPSIRRFLDSPRRAQSRYSNAYYY